MGREEKRKGGGGGATQEIWSTAALCHATHKLMARRRIEPRHVALDDFQVLQVTHNTIAARLHQCGRMMHRVWYPNLKDCCIISVTFYSMKKNA